jgi:uncharacterized membrane protein YfcA
MTALLSSKTDRRHCHSDRHLDRCRDRHRAARGQRNPLALLHDVVAFVSTLNIGGFSPAVAGVVTLVLFPAGVVSGLSGFAFSAVAACVLWLLPPLQAVPLIMPLSACNQLPPLARCGRRCCAARPSAGGGLHAGGLVGVPIRPGCRKLADPRSPVDSASSSSSTARSFCSSPTACGSSCRAEAGRGSGRRVGGFSAFQSMLVVYLGLRGVSKAETRGITQPYILALQVVSLSILALTHSAIFNAQFWLLWALTLPAVLLGSSTGVALYRRMSEVNFRRAVLILLIVSGISLLAKTLI